MTFFQPAGESPSGDTPNMADGKTRQCLRCHVSFESEWAGERICVRCKGTRSWRNGAPVQSFSTSGRS